MIRMENGKYVVYSETGRKFGTYDTQEAANKRLSQMEMFKHMKKTAAGPKLKNFFTQEPSCIVHGSGTQCVTGKGPNFSKKAEYVFKKLASPKTYYAIMREIGAAKSSIKNLRKFVNATPANDTKALTMYMSREKKLLDKIDKLKSQITN